MGAQTVKFVTEPEDQKRVFDLVLRDIELLQKMIEAGELDRQTQRIGAEQELVMIDHAFRPAPVITEFLKGIKDPRFTTELARFNIEINLTPQPLKGACFSDMEKELTEVIDKARKRGKKMGDIDVILTGILPTFRKMDMELENLTPNDRSRAMMEAMRWLKQKDYSIRINGIDDLSTTDFSNMFESCNTSFQIHYQLNPNEFATRYNFAQAIAAPVLAASSNSAILFGKRLWHETRIALFQQALDTREDTNHLSKDYVRVPFGHEWVKESVMEIFEDDLAKFKIFLEYGGTQADEDSPDMDHKKLRNLNVFNSSVYRWTRACYGVLDDNPHLRIENRLLPSGPTIKDEIANTAFWVGLMHGMPKKYSKIATDMPFEDAKINILKAARYGLDTQFRWLKGEKISAQDLILDELLPIAEKGLERAKVHKRDIKKYLGIIKQRVETGQTGSQWQFDAWAKMEHLRTNDAKATVLTAAMFRRQQEGKPVHEWSMPSDEELNFYVFSEIGQIMTTDIFSVKEEDLWDQTVYSMLKKDLEHIPVADKKGVLKGLVTRSVVLKQMVEQNQANNNGARTVKDVMEKDPVTVSPSTRVDDAIALMKSSRAKCLPVKHNNKLVGIVTEFDMMQVAEYLLKEKLSNNGKSQTQRAKRND